MRFLTCTLGVATALAFASTAMAQTASPFTASLGAATDYRSKGLSKSADGGYVFATADWKSSNGLIYAGVAAATVDVPFGADYETDLKAGVRPRLAGWDLDFAAFYRAFGDANPGADNDYVEFRAQATRSWGPVNLRLLTWQTPDNAGPVEEANWSEGRITWRAARKVRSSASLGYHDQENGPSYTAWNAGVAVDLTPKVELDLRWYDTDAHQFGSRYEGEAVATLVARF